MKKFKKQIPAILMVATFILIIMSAGYILLLLLTYTGVFTPYPHLQSADFSKEQISSVVIGIIVSKIFLIVALGLLFKVLKNVKHNHPFEKVTVKRFYLLGFLIFIMPIIEFVTAIFSYNPHYNALEIIAYNGIINRLSSFLILGIIMSTFAYMMRKGFEISEEQKLTV